MGLKEIVICPDIGKLRPLLHIHRVLVQIVDLRPVNCQKKGRVGGDDQLTVKEPSGIFQKLRQLLLLICGKQDEQFFSDLPSGFG